MLRSQDTEDKIVALTIINQHNPEDIKIPLLLFITFGHNLSYLWKEHAQGAWQYLQNIPTHFEYSPLSYQQMFAVVETSDHLEIACEYFGEFLTDRICKKIPGKITITFTPQ